jgi:hypothetical protein
MHALNRNHATNHDTSQPAYCQAIAHHSMFLAEACMPFTACMPCLARHVSPDPNPLDSIKGLGAATPSPCAYLASMASAKSPRANPRTRHSTGLRKNPAVMHFEAATQSPTNRTLFCVLVFFHSPAFWQKENLISLAGGQQSTMPLH